MVARVAQVFRNISSLNAAETDANPELELNADVLSIIESYLY
jgi:hypothetical protein